MRLCFAVLAFISPQLAHAQVFVAEQLNRFAVDPTVETSPGFAQSVDSSDGLLIVGSPGFDSRNIGSGSAFVYQASTGDLIRRLDHPLPDVNNVDFGGSVSISGTLAIVGDESNIARPSSPERVYVFDVATGDLVHTLSYPGFEDEDRRFGRYVEAVGNRVMVGGPLASTTVFDLETGGLVQEMIDPLSPFTIGFDFDGRHAVASTRRITGPTLIDYVVNATVFDVETGELVVRLEPENPEYFREGINSIAIDGNYVVVGMKNADTDAGFSSGTALAFDITTGEQLFELRPDGLGGASSFGSSVDIEDGIAMVGQNFSVPGNAYFFDLETGDQLARIQPDDIGFGDDFGRSVSLGDGYALVSAPGLNVVGSAYSYRYGLVPEPGTAGLLILAAAGAIVRRRR